MIGRLHVITDEVLQQRFDHVELATLALLGGADVIQYREKRAIPDGVRLAVARRLAELCGQHGAQLIIDDRADLAALVGAGLHVGPTDLPVTQARTLVRGPIGATANSWEMAQDPSLRSADYLGCGPAFGTTSKGATPPPTLGLVELARIVVDAAVPVVAIGGIGLGNLAQVMATGVHGVAVLGAVCLADDPRQATAALVQAMSRG